VVDSEVSFTVSPLLGKRDDFASEFLARQLIQMTSETSSRQLILSVSTRLNDPSSLKKIVEYVRSRFRGPSQVDIVMDERL
jgi:hypothetical protein